MSDFMRGLFLTVLLSLPAQAQIAGRSDFEACTIRHSMSAAGTSVCLRIVYDRCIPAGMSIAAYELELDKKTSPMLACLNAQYETILSWESALSAAHEIHLTPEQYRAQNEENQIYCADNERVDPEWSLQRALNEQVICRLRMAASHYQALVLDLAGRPYR